MAEKFLVLFLAMHLGLFYAVLVRLMLRERRSRSRHTHKQGESA